jgi:hypothetical protein
MTDIYPSEGSLRCHASEQDSEFVSQYSSRFKLDLDKDASYRQKKLYILNLFLKGTIYKNLQPWYQEYGYGGSGKYVPLMNRSPSIVYRIPQILVNDSTSMLFGSNHFPTVRCDNELTNNALQNLTRKYNLRYTMLAASRIGSLGSVCIIIKIVNGKFFFEAAETAHMMPIFAIDDATKLVSLVETKKVLGEILIEHGYEIKDENKRKYFYLIREWTEQEEIYYEPMLIESGKKLEDMEKVIDKKRSTSHDLGFLPAVWIKNTPTFNYIDGACTFQSVVELSIEVDYQLSQLGRLLRYNSDPTLVIKDPSGMQDQDIIKGIGQALMVGEGGDAKLLEMSTSSTKSVIDYVRCLREFALETARGNRTNPDKISALHSGKALQMLNSPIISFVEELRLCYGDNGLLKVYEMMLKMISSGVYDIELGGDEIGDIEQSLSTLRLDWPDWYAPTPQDDLQQAQTLSTLVQSHIVSQKTATESVSERYSIIDIEEEMREIQSSSEALTNAGKSIEKDEKSIDKE